MKVGYDWSCSNVWAGVVDLGVGINTERVRGVAPFWAAGDGVITGSSFEVVGVDSLGVANVRLSGGVLSGSVSSDVVLSGSALSKVALSGSALAGVVLSSCTLSDVVFPGSKLLVGMSEFSSSEFVSSEFEWLKFMLPKVRSPGATSSEAVLPGIVPLEAMLPGAVSSGMPLGVMLSAEGSDGGAKELAEKPSRRRFSLSAAPEGKMSGYWTKGKVRNTHRMQSSTTHQRRHACREFHPMTLRTTTQLQYHAQLCGWVT